MHGTAGFLGIERRALMSWALEVRPDICSGYSALFGGCGLAAAIIAMEGATDRQLVWATGQFVSNAVPGERVELDVVESAVGRRTTQLRVTGHVAGREVIVAFGAVGEEPSDPANRGELTVWVEPPEVDPPEQCPHRDVSNLAFGIGRMFEQRVAIGAPGAATEPTPGGRSAIWVRLPVGVAADHAMMAILGDFVPFGTRQALGQSISGVSLDNTYRAVAASPPPDVEWCLLDIRLDAYSRRYAHGNVHLWTDSGVLLGTATQTAQMRPIPTR